MNVETRQKILSGLIIVGVIAISTAIFIFKDQVKALEGWGYAGLFLVAFFASAAMFAPVPGLLVLAVSAKVLDPLASGLVFAVGASLGELSGYMVGLAGRGVVNKSKWHVRMEYYMKRYGGVTIAVLGFIPNFLIDIAGIVAGTRKLPWYQFLFWVFVGKVPKCLLITFGAAWFLQLYGLGN